MIVGKVRVEGCMTQTRIHHHFGVNIDFMAARGKRLTCFYRLPVDLQTVMACILEALVMSAALLLQSHPSLQVPLCQACTARSTSKLGTGRAMW